jgi:alpha-tubulin suppressor-like RCC1 family protein
METRSIVTLVCWGTGSRGSETVPRLIEALNRVVVVKVVAGDARSMALTRDGGVFSWGCGMWGKLGHGDVADQHVPKRVEVLTDVTDIAGGSSHSIAVTTGGAVFTWGFNSFGQLGLGEHGNRSFRVPTLVTGQWSGRRGCRRRSPLEPRPEQGRHGHGVWTQ